jgi:hyperosmotically inducible protein
MFRALFVIVLLVAIAWGLFYLYKGGSIPFVAGTVGDAKITASVKAALALHADLSRRPISVRTRDAIVLLTGEVASDEEKIAAGDLVTNVPGVEGVDNLIGVTPGLETELAETSRSLGQRLDDTALAAKVKGAFALHRDLKDLNINVDVRDRTVFLDGIVETREQAESARNWANQVEGVEGVESALEAKGSGETADHMAERIQSILRQNENLAGYKLRASAVGGTVVLEGAVATGAELELAELLAERIAGKDKLTNRITVRKE